MNLRSLIRVIFNLYIWPNVFDLVQLFWFQIGFLVEKSILVRVPIFDHTLAFLKGKNISNFFNPFLYDFSSYLLQILIAKSDFVFQISPNYSYLIKLLLKKNAHTLRTKC